MCGRFTLHHSVEELAERFAVEQISASFALRYNIAPTQPVAAIRQTDKRLLDALRWGLVPFWAKDPKIGNRMINARAETLAEKPAFRAALKRRRCLLPASGFYEWKKEEDGAKTPHFIRLEDGRPFAMAGLWEEWKDPEGEILRSCTIITTRANDFMTGLHARMPVILGPEQEEVWLDPELEDPQGLVSLLTPYPGPMAAHPVSTRVNKPAYDEPDCIEAL